MPEPQSEAELLAGCVQGRKESWDAFVDRFSKLIYWSIRKTLETSSYKSHPDLAGDIFQDCFTRILEKRELENLRNIDSLRKFLTVFAAHMTMDKIRVLAKSHHRTRVELDEVEIADTRIESADDQLIANERAALISSALSELSSKQRLCFEWHYHYGKTHREISETLGVPLDTVSATIRRARERIKQVLMEKDK